MYQIYDYKYFSSKVSFQNIDFLYIFLGLFVLMVYDIIEHKADIYFLLLPNSFAITFL